MILRSVIAAPVQVHEPHSHEPAMRRRQSLRLNCCYDRFSDPCFPGDAVPARSDRQHGVLQL
jgi:hypothetical protein